MKKITDYAELVKAKHALNKTIAPVEDGASMAGSYTSGQQFIRGGVLYTALTSIAAGTAWSSLTLDTDYEVADDVSTQIAAVNQTLTQEVTAMVNVLGSKNILPNNVEVGTVSGVTFTKNADGSISISGTATADIYQTVADVSLKAGKYVLNGAPSGSSSSTSTIYATVLPNFAPTYIDNGNGVEFTLANDSGVRVNIVVANGQTVNKTFYPMIRDARIADATYEPYAMTNQAITDNIHGKYIIESGDVVIANISADGVKTYSQLLAEVKTAISSYLSSNNKFAIGIKITMDYLNFIPMQTSFILPMSTGYLYQYNAVVVNSTDYYVGTVDLDAATYYLAASGVVTDKSNEVKASGAITVTAIILDKVDS